MRKITVTAMSTESHQTPVPQLHVWLLIVVSLVFCWSLIDPRDLFTWGLEVFPAVIGAGILLATYRRFRLTDVSYVLVCIHAMILFIGGHYTYAEMPLFNWLRDALHLQRNYYDRLGHLAQGFVPAILTREVLLRCTPLRRGGMLFFLVIAVCLSVSAAYELLEWGVAMATGSAADAFLGTQGDVWDTQWDMFCALCGALIALFSLTRLHDRQLDASHDSKQHHDGGKG